MPTCLILRDKEDAIKTALDLKKQGFDSVIESIFSVEKIFTNTNNKNPQALVLTSSKACEAIINCNFSRNIKIFSVGKKSALPLVKSGYDNIFYPKKTSAQGLKQALAENLNPNHGKILYFCGNDITLDFEKELQPLGFAIEKILSYKINWHKNFSYEFLQLIQNKSIDFVLIYSQNGLHKFYNLAKNNNLLEYFSNSKIVCLSNKIADEAKKLGFKNLEDFETLKTCQKQLKQKKSADLS